MSSIDQYCDLMHRICAYTKYYKMYNGDNGYRFFPGVKRPGVWF
jgi:hypothetical protein